MIGCERKQTKYYVLEFCLWQNKNKEVEGKAEKS